MTSQFLAAAVSVALIGTGFAGLEGTRSFEALPTVQTAFADGDGAGSKCDVQVARSGTPGTADITREVLSNGGCVCHVSTGPQSGNGSAEGIVTALLRDRECDGARAVGRVVSETATTGGGSGAILPVVLTVAAGAGIGVALGNHSPG